MYNRCLRLRVVLQHLRMSAKFCTSVEDDVLFQKINSTGVITLNRPKALNALNLSMIRKIYPQMKEWESDPNMALIIIKASGDKAFCAGGDIRAVTAEGKKNNKLGETFFKEEYYLNHKIATCKLPYVALIDGITMGGGFGLSVHGRYRVATEKTLFAMPETGIGLFPDVGGGYFLPRLQHKLGYYLPLTGFRLKGVDVKISGIATHYVERSKISELESELTTVQPSETGRVQEILDRFDDQCRPDSSHKFALEPHLEEITSLFTATTMEELYANLEKHGSEWSLNQLSTLKKMSPISMKISLRQLVEGATRSIEDCLQTEYRMSQRCLQDDDFHEGVRALIIDKDMKPKWNPDTLEGVTAEHVDWYFSPLPDGKDLVLPPSA